MDLRYVCTLTEGALHLKSKCANILKAYCTLTEGVLHRYISVFKLINTNLITFPGRLSQTPSKGSIRCELV